MCKGDLQHLDKEVWMAAAVQKCLLLLVTNPELLWLNCTHSRPLEHNGCFALQPPSQPIFRAASNCKHRNEDRNADWKIRNRLVLLYTEELIYNSLMQTMYITIQEASAPDGHYKLRL